MKLGSTIACLAVGATLIPLTIAQMSSVEADPVPAPTTYTGEIIGYKVDGDGNVTKGSIDTDGDGVADKEFTCSLPNSYFQSFETWRMNGTTVEWEDTDSDCKVDTDEEIGPPL